MYNNVYLIFLIVFEHVAKFTTKKDIKQD